jgi:hypothetical protein
MYIVVDTRICNRSSFNVLPRTHCGAACVFADLVLFLCTYRGGVAFLDEFVVEPLRTIVLALPGSFVHPSHPSIDQSLNYFRITDCQTTIDKVVNGLLSLSCVQSWQVGHGWFRFVCAR